MSGPARAVLGTSHATAVSVSAEAGNGEALVSVAATETVQSELTHRTSRPTHRIARHRGAPRPARAARLTFAGAGAGAGPAIVARTSAAVPDLELALALMLAAAGAGVWRWRGVR